MKKVSTILTLLLTNYLLWAVPGSEVAPLPDPVSNNAVAMLKVHGDLQIFSFMGIGAKKTWDAVTTEAYSLDASTGKAFTIHPVPGTAGRIGAMAIGAGDRVVLVGGYVLYQGGGMAVPDVNLYEPAHDRWERGPDMPTPVGDGVIGVYHERYVYVIGGRSNRGPVSTVQIFDLEKNRWSTGTPIPGDGIFGHAGAIVGESIILVDGARSNSSSASLKYLATEQCWEGKIDHHHPGTIAWSKLPAHPGAARFRIAAGGSEKDEKVYFVGGTDNPFDYHGVGYDGKPSEPSPVSFDFNLRTGKWETINENLANPTMDHRGLLVTREGLVVIGGMGQGQEVTGRVVVLPKEPQAQPAPPKENKPK